MQDSIQRWNTPLQNITLTQKSIFFFNVFIMVSFQGDNIIKEESWGFVCFYKIEPM